MKKHIKKVQPSLKGPKDSDPIGRRCIPDI